MNSTGYSTVPALITIIHFHIRWMENETQLKNANSCIYSYLEKVWKFLVDLLGSEDLCV